MNFKEICKVVDLLNKHYTKQFINVRLYKDESGVVVDGYSDDTIFDFNNEEDFYNKALGILEKDDLDPEKRLLAIINKEMY